MVNEKLLKEVGDLVNLFIFEQRRILFPIAAELPNPLLERYTALFENDEGPSKAARVAFVDRLPDPTELNEFLVKKGLPELKFGSFYGGMTFVDTIALSKERLRVSGFDDIERDERKKPDLTLFHELVHILQFRALHVDPNSSASIDLFTKWQVPGYFQMWGLDGEKIRYEEIAFEDAATVAESAYQSGADGLEIAYYFMRARGIPFDRV